MAEALSLQMAKLAAIPSQKLQANERHGVKRIMFAQIASISAAINDTIFLGRIPPGCRITGVQINNAAGTAASTMAIGLRSHATGVVIAAAGLSAATAISAAQNVNALTGTLVAAGLSYQTLEEVEVYGTIAGAVTPVSPGQLISVIVDYVVD